MQMPQPPPRNSYSAGLGGGGALYICIFDKHLGFCCRCWQTLKNNYHLSSSSLATKCGQQHFCEQQGLWPSASYTDSGLRVSWGKSETHSALPRTLVFRQVSDGQLISRGSFLPNYLCLLVPQATGQPVLSSQATLSTSSLSKIIKKQIFTSPHPTSPAVSKISI